MELDTTNTYNDQHSDIIIKVSKYDHTKKAELAKNINKIKKKEYLVNIFRILTSSSKDYTENTNGVFIFFHNLSDEVYEKVDAYINLIFKLHKKKSSLKSILTSELSENIQILSDTCCSDNIEFDNIKELSNKEKMIMRRKKYEEYLNQNQNQNQKLNPNY
jgi:hypothetical protein